MARWCLAFARPAAVVGVRLGLGRRWLGERRGDGGASRRGRGRHGMAAARRRSGLDKDGCGVVAAALRVQGRAALEWSKQSGGCTVLIARALGLRGGSVHPRRPCRGWDTRRGSWVGHGHRGAGARCALSWRRRRRSWEPGGAPRAGEGRGSAGPRWPAGPARVGLGRRGLGQRGRELGRWGDLGHARGLGQGKAGGGRLGPLVGWAGG